MYEKIYPQAKRIIKHSLSRSKCYFDEKGLDAMLKNIEGIRGKIPISEVKSLLFEVGVLGIKNKESVIGDGEKFLWECLFEYQIHGNLPLNPSFILVIHPMFYEELFLMVDRNCFIYPKPFEDEECFTINNIKLFEQ